MAIQTLFGGQPYLPTGIERGAVQPQVARAAGHPEEPDFTEYGASGTPIFGGFLRERGEYNPELAGLAAVYTYEQMRRSDAQVAATLQAIKLPILAATWDVKVPQAASAVEREAAEFVRQVFFEDLNFTSILRNALLELDFGFAVHEDVWRATGNRIRLAKLAPRLPITAYRWLTDESGENLAALEQMGYRGSEYIVTQIPANKMDVFTFNQEGQNYTGLALLRPMYQHWYIKSNLYKVDAMTCERNGMGVPTVTMGEDAKREDRENALQWVQSLVAHERTGLVLPHGWSFKLEGVTGQLRDPKDSIAHHNMAISMAGLAMFLMLGESSHGSRALGVTMSDFFLLSLEATARQIARTLNLGTVKRLVDYNFSGIQHYPQLVPQQMLTLKFDAVVEALNKLAQFGVVAPDDKLESWMREKMGAPEPEKRRPDPAGTPPEAPVSSGQPKAPIPADSEEEIGAPAGGGDAGVDPQSGAVMPEPEEIEAAAQVISQAMSSYRPREAM
jgi:phage gp29-like protein